MTAGRAPSFDARIARMLADLTELRDEVREARQGLPTGPGKGKLRQQANALSEAVTVLARGVVK
jgi:hypothetical protein